ncbi:hypothetical protein GCM10011506_36070 [Marivirga lumbricoides]|uniref:histidine kinase n=1 Tax=Marivirga lumbricoides TaxID=1046115 RepID=A0ABQ1MZI1_9BACT|nr:hypothetical protein GCM10011506_36070 [Marivirga lumbricoides]
MNQYKDSLQISGQIKDSWYEAIGRLYLQQDNYDSAKKYYLLALNTKSVNNDQLLKAYILNNLGVIFSPYSIDSTLYYYTQAKNIYLTEGDSLKVASCGINLGIVYKNLGLYERALEQLFESALVLEKINEGRYLASCYNTIALIYSRQNDLIKSLEYHKESLKIRKELQMKQLVASSYNNIGIIYRKLEEYDSSLFYYENSLKIKKEQQDTLGIGVTLNNIGLVLMDQKKYDLAEPYLKKSLELRTIKDDEAGIAITKNNLGLLYLNTGENTLALAYLNEAALLIQSLGLLEEMKVNWETKLQVYEELGLHQNALEASKNLIIVKDSLLNIEKTESLVEMQTKYETEKRSREIEMLEQSRSLQEGKLKLRQIWISLLILCAVFLSILGFLLRNRWRKEKVAKIKVEVLMQELHHRVKNNLQLLSSIFSLQSRGLQDTNAIEVIKSSENRINAMAIIHQKLYKNSESRNIDLKSYFTEMIEELAESYGYDVSSHNIKIHIDPIDLDVDKVIPLGLIVNELVSNSFKYAFPNHENPSLMVELKYHQKHLELEVADTGSGFNREQVTKDSMGLNIIDTLSRQLKATVKWQTKGCVKFNLKVAI